MVFIVSCHLMAIDPVRPCGRLILRFPVAVSLYVNIRSGIAAIRGRTNAGIVGIATTLPVHGIIFLLFLLVTMTANVLWVWTLRRPETTPLRRIECFPGDGTM